MPLLTNESNAAMLGLSFLFMLVLLIASVLKKNKTMMSAPFITQCSVVTLLQFVAFLEWLWTPGAYALSLFKLLIILEYLCSYLSVVSLYWYVETYVYALSHPAETRRPEEVPAFLKWAWGLGTVAVTLLLSSVRSGWLFDVSETGSPVYSSGYVLLYIISFGWSVALAVFLIRNRKQLTLSQLLLMLSYVFIPTAFYVLDLFSGLSMGCVVSALIFFLIYARIDNAQGERLLENKALLLQKEAEMTETKMELMMSQIQPHFLYNALSSISYLCTEDPEEARKATNEFSDYLKGNLRFIGAKTPIPFEIELNHVEQYLNIEKRRFSDRLRVVYDIRERNFFIPALTLQTLVENAVRYSVNARYEPTTVTLCTDCTDTEYTVSILDDGPGFDPDARLSDDRRHIGLSGARVRLKEMLNGTLEIRSILGKGTTVIIHIPKEVCS